jgi:hypothetical protein
MTDILEDLLREALKHELNSKRGKGTLKRLKGITDCVHSIYSDPDNWREGMTLSLIHTAGDGSETSLGIFHEFTHKRTAARRLIPCPDGAIDGVEYVRGDYWLYPSISEPIPTTLGDVIAIRAYISRVSFSQRLMKEINGEALLRELEDLG